MKQALEAGRRSPLSEVEQWHAEYNERLARVLMRTKFSRFHAPDALQEMWLGVLLRPPPADIADSPQRLFAWLVVSLTRRAADLKRRHRLRAHLPLGDDEHTADASEDLPERAERAEQVRRVLSDLYANGSASAARLLELRFCDGLPVRAIGRELGVSPRRVTARLQRAQRMFRARWGGVDNSD
jgi:RNA polymerase sigma factor (sigma-70 family)